MRKVLIAMLAAAVLWPSVEARADGFDLGIGAIAAAPVSDFNDRYAYGAGVAVFGEHSIIPLLNIAWQGSWLRFQRDEDNIRNDDRQLDVFGISAGPQLDLAFFLLGVDAGYFTEVDEWAVVPRMSFRIWLLDIGAEYVVTDKFDWVTGRLSLVF